MENIYNKTVTATDTNNTMIECSHPKLEDISIEATVIMLYKYVLDHLLMNGLVVCVQKIPPFRLWESGAFMAYAVSDFSKFLIKEYHILFTEKPHI